MKIGTSLLDLEQPWQVIYRGGPYQLSPQTYDKCAGDVPNVVFPCATLYDQPTGRIAIYYRGADTATVLAFARLDESLYFIKTNSEL